MSEAKNIEIEKHLRELLYSSECVIIPNFGGMVASKMPAYIDETKNLIFPPFKKFAFNTQMTFNDGSLIQEIAKNENITYDLATQLLNECVAKWRRSLELGKEINIESVGVFKLDKDKHIVFDQDFSENYLAESYGLTPIHLLEVERKGLGRKLNERIAENNGSGVIDIRKYSKYAAAAILVPALAFGLYYTVSNVPMNIASFNISEAFEWFSSDDSQVKPSDQIEKNNTSVDVTIKTYYPAREKFFTPDEIAALDAHENRKSDLAKEVIDKSIPKVKSEIISTEVVTQTPVKIDQPIGKYQVVAGAFSVYSNAEKLTAQLQEIGFEAHIAGETKSGLTRVVYGSFDKRIDALKALAKAKLKHSSKAWMLVEK